MIRAITFTADKPKNTESEGITPKKLSEKGKFHDPLNHWTVQTALYSSELGAAINEIAPSVGLALWVPTFMYMGADIYDKYKNDKNNKYAPSSKRGIKRAIFQTFSTILLPAFALILGQKITSPVGKFIKGGISLNARDQTYHHCKHFIDQCIGETFNDKARFKESLKNSLDKKVDAVKNEKRSNNIFKRIKKMLRGDYALAYADKNKLNTFIDEHSEELFNIQRQMRHGIKPDKVSKKLFNEYITERPKLKKLYGNDYAYQALKTTLKKYENLYLYTNKLIKTAGGLVSLLLLAHPIYYFTKHFIMEKFVNPGIDILTETNFSKLHVKNMLQNMEVPSDTPQLK